MIGILALQGCVEPHKKKFEELQVACKEVRKPADLSGVSGLVLPGGESSTMLKLLHIFNLFDELKQFEQPMWGICAGAILLAEKVTHPDQESLARLPFTAERNGYGRQVDSFSCSLDFAGRAQDAVFIRAPRFHSIDSQVQVLANHDGEPVALQYGNKLVTAFHPEIAAGCGVHHYFVEMVKAAAVTGEKKSSAC